MHPLFIVFGAIFLSGLGTAAYLNIQPNMEKGEREDMVAQNILLISSVQDFAQAKGHANVVNIAGVVTAGYLSDKVYTDGVGETVIDTDFTAVSATASTTTFTYDAGSQPACSYVSDSWAQFPGVETAPTCTAGVMSATISG